MGRQFKQLTRTSRISMETLLNMGHSVSEIARYLGVHRSTIYREIKRGFYLKRDSEYREVCSYSSDIAQQKRDYASTSKGRNIKLGNNYSLAEFIEQKIADERYSPAAAISEAVQCGQFEDCVCSRTVYRYIDKGIFLRLTNRQLPVKGNRKSKKRHIRVQKKANAGTSIEQRPDDVEERKVFGHWEMDTVKGKQGITKSCLLVLTERKTRDEIIAKLPDQKAASVVEFLDRMERKWGSLFSHVFRSITVDNGVEFAYAEQMEASKINVGEKRTHLFYCHPYSSWERGSNENQNRLIRRFIPKGENFDNRHDDDIAYIENWINNYPRKKLGFKTSAQLFEEEINRIQQLA